MSVAAAILATSANPATTAPTYPASALTSRFCRRGLAPGRDPLLVAEPVRLVGELQLAPNHRGDTARHLPRARRAARHRGPFPRSRGLTCTHRSATSYLQATRGRRSGCASRSWTGPSSRARRRRLALVGDPPFHSRTRFRVQAAIVRTMGLRSDAGSAPHLGVRAR